MPMRKGTRDRIVLLDIPDENLRTCILILMLSYIFIEEKGSTLDEQDTVAE